MRMLDVRFTQHLLLAFGVPSREGGNSRLRLRHARWPDAAHPAHPSAGTWTYTRFGVCQPRMPGAVSNVRFPPKYDLRQRRCKATFNSF
jgi:hypothetical protein